MKRILLVIFLEIISGLRCNEIIHKKNRAVIITNIKNFHVTHSNFIREVKSLFSIVDLKTPNDVHTKSFAFKKYKEYIYDLIIFACARCKNALSIAEDIELVKFYE